MSGRIIVIVLFLTFLVWLFPTMIFYEIHNTSNDRVEELTDDLVELTSTSGKLTGYNLDMFKEDISVFGDMSVTIRLKKVLSDEAMDITFDEATIVDRKLQKGDWITVSVSQQDASMYERLLNIPITVFSGNTRYSRARINAVATSPITKEAVDLVYGYDVIAEIQNNTVDPTISVFVTTKINSTGKLYDNEVYGDDVDEINVGGANHISEYAEFRESIELQPDNSIIKYFYQVY